MDSLGLTTGPEPEPTSDTAAHPPCRPTWECLTCGEAWPCPVARDQIAAQWGSDRVGLSVYLGIQMERAAAETTQVTAGELFGRFLSWTR